MQHFHESSSFTFPVATQQKAQTQRSATTHSLRLDQLPKQTTAWITALSEPNHPEEFDLLLRLLELGFVPGESVRIIERGFPFADPLAVRVGRSTTFALRSYEASLIHVSQQNPEKPL